MKKIIYFIFVIIFLLLSLSVTCFCTEEDSLLSDTQEELFGALDDDTKEILEAFGIDSLDYDKIYSFSFSQIGDFFSETLSEKANETIKTFMLLSGVLLILCAVRTLVPSSSNSSTAELLCTVVMIIFTVSKLSEIINTVLSVVNMSAKFLLAYIPIFAALVAFSGNPSGALTYNTLALAFAQGLSAFSSSFAIPVVGGFYCLSIAFSFNENMNLSRFVSAFNRASSVVLGLISSLFAGLLSIKGIMSVSLDSVSAKGIRFMLSSMIPVVGSAISEAYSALVGSIGLIKSSVAAVGIIVCLIINIPAIICGVLYYIMLSCVSFFAEAASMQKISAVMKAFATGIKFLLLLVIFEMFILIISTGLMLMIKNTI
ncbi:MAG: hypothetical protein ACI4W6_07455 [Acutalibacteraceae bacterium]